jgi:hypothetical protein
MKRPIAVIVVLIIVLAGFGLYRGWFTVNKARLQQDEQTAREKIRELEQKAKDRTADLRDQLREKKKE